MADVQVETKRCKYCDNDIAVANIQVHEIHCQRHLRKCKKCGQAVHDLQKHEEEEHKLVTCEYCSLEVEEDELKGHKINCNERPVLCPYCSVEFPYSSYAEHEDHCGSRTDECEKCQAVVRLRDMLKHESSNCAAFKIEQQRPMGREPAYAPFPPLRLRPRGHSDHPANSAFGMEGKTPLPKIPNSQANKQSRAEHSRPPFQSSASERDLSPPSLDEELEVRPEYMREADGGARPRVYGAPRGVPGGQPTRFRFAFAYFPATRDPGDDPMEQPPPSHAPPSITHIRPAAHRPPKPSKEVKRDDAFPSRGTRSQKPKVRTGVASRSTPQRKKAPESLQNEEVIVLPSDVKLPDPDSEDEECFPCEYCNMQLPQDALMRHQTDCGEGQTFDMYGQVKTEISQPIAITDEPSYGINEAQEFVAEGKGNVRNVHREEDDDFNTRHFRHEDVKPLSHSQDDLRSTEGEYTPGQRNEPTYEPPTYPGYTNSRGMSFGSDSRRSRLQQMMGLVDPFADEGDEDFAYCQYCDFPFPMNAIMQHEVLCPKATGDSTAAPDTGYGVHSSPNVGPGMSDLSPPKPSPTSGINSISLADVDYNQSRKVSPPSSPTRVHGEEDNFASYCNEPEDVVLPCEFCEKDFSADMLDQHQFVCSKRFMSHSYGDEQEIGIGNRNNYGYSGSQARSNNRNRGLENTFNNN